jgi:iron(III) transport system permease protein
MRSPRDPVRPLSWAVAIVLLLLVGPPILILVANSLFEVAIDGTYGAFTLENFTRLLSQANLLRSAGNSLVFALGATVVALVLGGTLAWIVERTNAPFRMLAYLMTIISLGMPFIVYVPAWLFFLGPAGPINDTYRSLTGGSELLFDVSSMTGMVLIEGFGWIPLVFLLFAASFRASNAELEEAARMSGATVFQMMMRVSLPLAAPAAIATGLFVFIRALESFDVPKLVGTAAGIQVMTTDIYDSIRTVPPQIGHASAFSVLLTVLIAVLMYFYGRLSLNASRFATVTGKGFRPRPLDLGRMRWLGGLFIVLTVMILLILPLLTLLWVAVTPYTQAFRLAALPTMTLDNFVIILTDSTYIELIINTLIIATAAATGTMALMVLAGWIAARRRALATLIDQLTTVPLLLPGIVLGVAMMDVALRSPISLYSTLTIVVIAFMVRYMPYGMRYTFTGVMQIHKELEESAGVSGASSITTLLRIVVPLLWPAILSGWLFVFLNSARELSIALILAGPDTKTIAVAVYDQASNGQFSEVAALGLLWTALMSIFAMAFFIVARRRNGAFGF